MNITIDVPWNIMPANETPGMNANRFDQPTQGDQPIGPEPDSPDSPAPEVDGK
jgi:hypothetical protein